MQTSESEGKMSRRRSRQQSKHQSSGTVEPFVLQTRKRKAETPKELQPVLDEHSSWKKRHLEVEWSNKTPSPCRLLPTPQKDDDDPLPESTGFTQYRFNNLFLNHDRPQPLPKLSWANSEEVWSNLLKKEQTYIRDKNALLRHPALQPRMRAILLDWLIEVCEVYRLRRETFYLAQDFFDRFLSTQQGLEKTMLQLIGITSLFIAAKAEEIYPPKLVQFAYVTDGACTDDEILRMELILLKALQWGLCPVTVNCWLNLYLQIATKPDCSEVLMPHYSQETFIRIAQLLDLCILDMRCLEFPYAKLAASALYHFSCLELVQRVSGHCWSELAECVRWMVPFAMVVRENSTTKLKSFKQVSAEERHNIQTHVNSLEFLDRVQELQRDLLRHTLESPVPNGVLTPPQSSRKE
uniref:G1/S-specific cyclin-E1 isoform X2 n=1 Tax=Myxine glutinosa TaxID=7769 RepID=UPI00358EBDF5